MTKPNPQIIEAILAADEKRTQGEWKAEWRPQRNEYTNAYYIVTGCRAELATSVADDIEGGPMRIGGPTEHNANFIALSSQAPTQIRALLAQVEEMRGLIEKHYREAVADMDEAFNAPESDEKDYSCAHDTGRWDALKTLRDAIADKYCGGES